MQPRYFNRDGHELSKREALDHRGVIKDGVVARFGNVTMMDHRTVGRFTDDGVGRYTGLDGSELSVHQPGYRIRSDNLGAKLFRDAKARQAVEDAQAEYLHDLQNAWRNPPGLRDNDPVTGFGEKGSTGGLGQQRDDQDGDMRLCPDCDGTGKDDAGSECQVCGGTGLVPHNSERSAEEIVENASTHHEGLGSRSARRADSDTVRQLMADHDRKMGPLYEAIESELREKWRRP